MPASRLAPPTGYPSGAFDPALSADGSTLYFASNVDLTNAADATGGGIYKYDVASGALTLVILISESGGSTDANWILNNDQSTALDGVAVSAEGRYVAVGGNLPVSTPADTDLGLDNDEIEDADGLKGVV